MLKYWEKALMWRLLIFKATKGQVLPPMYLKNYHGFPIEAKDFASTIGKVDLDATYFKDHIGHCKCTSHLPAQLIAWI